MDDELIITMDGNDAHRVDVDSVFRMLDENELEYLPMI